MLRNFDWYESNNPTQRNVFTPDTSYMQQVETRDY
jgi:hypothetical protein